MFAQQTTAIDSLKKHFKSFTAYLYKVVMQSPNSNQLNIIKVSGDAYYDSVASIKNFVFYGFNTYSNEHNTYYRCNYSKNEVEQFHFESQASI